ncbi:hypothetical protein ACWGJ9_09300 [Curtobacterium citreum]
MSIRDLAARLEAARLPEERRRGPIFEALIREVEGDISDDAAFEGLPLTFTEVVALIHDAPTIEPTAASHRVRTLHRLRRRIYKPLHDGMAHPLTLHLPGGTTDSADADADAAEILAFYGRALSACADPAIARYLTVSNLVAAGYPFLRLPWQKGVLHPGLAPALAAARAGDPLRYLELVVGTAGR